MLLLCFVIVVVVLESVFPVVFNQSSSLFWHFLWKFLLISILPLPPSPSFPILPCHPTPRPTFWSPGRVSTPSVSWCLRYLVPWHFLVIWYVFVPEWNKHSLSFFPLSFCMFLWLLDVGLFAVGPVMPLSLKGYPYVTKMLIIYRVTHRCFLGICYVMLNLRKVACLLLKCSGVCGRYLKRKKSCSSLTWCFCIK